MTRQASDELLKRITVDPGQCAGRPCVRGMRIRVSDVLDLLAAGESADQIADELEIEVDDVRACLVYAAKYFDPPRMVA